MTESSAGLVWPLRSAGSLTDKALVDEDLWEVALPSGEVKRMTLDQLDRAFQVGLIHSNSLVRENGGSEWQTLGLLAGLDEDPPTQQPPTQKADEPGRSSVLPAPPDETRETLAGLGGFLQVAPVGNAPPPEPAQPPLGSRPQPFGARSSTAVPRPMVSRAATLPMPSGAPPPMPKPVAQAKQPAASESRPPPLPPNAFGGAPIPAAPIQPITAAVPPSATAALPSSPPKMGSAPPPSPPKTGSGPPPLPASAFGSSPPAASRGSAAPPLPASVPPLQASGISPAGTAPRASGPPALPTSAPPFAVTSTASVPVVEPAPLGTKRRSARGERWANVFIGLMALATLLVILQRNGILFQLSVSMGMKHQYLLFERQVLGAPTLLTPRGVEMLTQAAASDQVPATASSTDVSSPTATP